MKRTISPTILGRITRDNFIGRSLEISRIIEHAYGDTSTRPLFVLGKPLVGTSELLRQVYDYLFLEQDEIVPVYFELKTSDVDSVCTASRFQYEFVLQTVAFRRRDSHIVNASPGFNELAEMAMPSDGPWIDRLVETVLSDPRVPKDPAFIQQSFSSPFRAVAKGLRCVVMIDGLHNSEYLSDGDRLLETLFEVAAGSDIPIVLAGHRRFLFGKTQSRMLSVDSLPFNDAADLAARLAGRSEIETNEQACRLIALQLGGNTSHISTLVSAAEKNSTPLKTFDDVQKAYTDEIFGGNIGRYFGNSLDQIIPDADTQTSLLQLLGETLESKGQIPAAYWRKHLRHHPNRANSIIHALHNLEMINAQGGFIHIDKSDLVLNDYIKSRSALELENDARAPAVGEALLTNIERAPIIMARHYRRSAALGVREIMSVFDGQTIASSLIDYGRFKSELKGLGDDEILRIASDDEQTVTLPNVIYTAQTEWFYPQLTSLCEAECSAIAIARQRGTDAKSIYWIAVEIDSKLEATHELAEFWCDRLEMVAASNELDDCRFWLVAPEGFSNEANDMIRTRNAYGSSRKQVELLSRFLGRKIEGAKSSSADEYEFVVPMGSDSEMVAANTVQEIAKRHNFSPKAINQMKTALVEACINAAEHSLSPDRKIYQKFVVDPEKITITVSNRGLRLSEKSLREVIPSEGRRGWGLKLMRKLMDDVRIEESDDGSKIVMTKFVNAATTGA